MKSPTHVFLLAFLQLEPTVTVNLHESIEGAWYNYLIYPALK